MAWFVVSTAYGPEYLEADSVAERDNYERGIVDGQQPAIYFYKGYNHTRENVVGHYILKNIGGYRKLRSDELVNNKPLLR